MRQVLGVRFVFAAIVLAGAVRFRACEGPELVPRSAVVQPHAIQLTLDEAKQRRAAE